MAQRLDWSRFLNISISVLAFSMGIYHLAYTQWIFQDAAMHQNTHLTFALLLVFLVSLSNKPKLWPYLLCLIILSLVGVSYVFINYSELMERAGIPVGLDVIMGVIIVIVVLEACRQAFGWIIPSLAVAMIVYALVSPHLPPPFFHTPISFSKVISWSCIAFRGVYGQFLQISSTYMILFLLFGGLIQATGVSESFIEIGKALGRKMRSGPAQTAIVSSALVGTVMGAGIANVAFTGPITIPVMKKAGYSPDQAGAIETAASTGGQFTPPIMSVAAFLMAGFLGVSYANIIYAAVIPAAIYFLSLIWVVHVLALKQNISVSREEKVDFGIIWRRFPVFIVPLALIVVLLIRNYSPTFAAFWAIITILILSSIRKETRLSWDRLIGGFRTGCVAAAKLAVAIATVGVLYSMLSLTGVGMEVAYTVEQWSMGIPFIAIFVCMCVTIILGCGMPIPAAYALVAIVVAPVLVRLGFVPIQVHFFIFYFAAVSNLSPPVAGTALMASSISGGNYFRTGLESMKLAAPGFIVPWLFLYNPNLLSDFSGLLPALTSIAASIVLIFSFESCLLGYLFAGITLKERAIYLLVSILLIGFVITLNIVLFIIGIVLFLIVFLRNIRIKLNLGK
ncbi:TRAP transporter permease [Thermodesulfobacteriota bacterium]